MDRVASSAASLVQERTSPDDIILARPGGNVVVPTFPCKEKRSITQQKKRRDKSVRAQRKVHGRTMYHELQSSGAFSQAMEDGLHPWSSCAHRKAFESSMQGIWE
jgi:hypothetical protein